MFLFFIGGVIEFNTNPAIASEPYDPDRNNDYFGMYDSCLLLVTKVNPIHVKF